MGAGAAWCCDSSAPAAAPEETLHGQRDVVTETSAFSSPPPQEDPTAKSTAAPEKGPTAKSTAAPEKDPTATSTAAPEKDPSAKSTEAPEKDPTAKSMAIPTTPAPASHSANAPTKGSQISGMWTYRGTTCVIERLEGFVITSPTTCKFRSCRGELGSDGKIEWDDGSVWIREDYPGASLQLFEGTPFAEALARGDIAVISSAYFEQCLQKGQRFADRANIPEEFFFKGQKLMDLWKKHGYFFLVVISYGWLAKDHPDPKLFHLQRLVRILKEWKLRSKENKENQIQHNYDPYCFQMGGEVWGTFSGEIGVILDFCSLWQGERTPEQQESFGRGLKLINAPYCHRDVGAIKLTDVPTEELRKYDDRGWTCFESCVIDGKERSSKGSPYENGELNIITVDDSFDPDAEEATGEEFLQKYAHKRRMPLCTPEAFEQRLNERGERAKGKGVNLFTSGKDQPFILKKYKDCFEELTGATTLFYRGTDAGRWGDGELATLAQALPSCKRLTELDLSENEISDISPLGKALKGNTVLETLTLGTNQFRDISTIAEALKGNSTLTTLDMSDNKIRDVSALAKALKGNSTLTSLDITSNEDIKDYSPLKALKKNCNAYIYGMMTRSGDCETMQCQLGS